MSRRTLILACIAALIVTFAAGAVTGYFWPRTQVVRVQTRIMAGADPLFEGVDLSPTQRDSIDAIIARTRPRTDSLLSDALPALRAALDTMQQQLLAVLTPAQRAEAQRRLRAAGRAAPADTAAR